MTDDRVIATATQVNRNMIDERTEQLINRRLDGALDRQEQLELDRRLIRSPEARELMEAYQHMDSLASESLRSLLREPDAGTPCIAFAVDDPPSALAGRRGHGATGLAAAAMIALVLAGLPSRWAPLGTAGPSPDTQLTEPEPARLGPHEETVRARAEHPAHAFDRPGDGMPTRDFPDSMDVVRDRRQHVTRHFIGVTDDDGDNIYLLEVSRRDPMITPVAYSY